LGFDSPLARVWRYKNLIIIIIIWHRDYIWDLPITDQLFHYTTRYIYYNSVCN